MYRIELFMKQIVLIILLFSLTCSQKLHIMTEELAPYGYFTNDTLTGLTVDIVRELLTSMDIEEEIHVYPWARAYMKIQTEPNQVLFCMAKTAERDSLFNWVGPLFSDQIYFYKRRNSSLNISSIEDAKNVHRILVTRDFPQHIILKKEGFTNLDVTVNQEQSIRMFSVERGDLIVIGQVALDQIAEELSIDPDQFEKTVRLFQVNLYIAFSKDIPLFEVERWQAELDKLKSSGGYDRLLQKYIN